MKDTSGDSKEIENSSREAANEEEDGYLRSAKECRCDMCPDLSKDGSFTFCKSVSKSRNMCQEENLSCICFAKKIEKLLDKA